MRIEVTCNPYHCSRIASSLFSEISYITLRAIPTFVIQITNAKVTELMFYTYIEYKLKLPNCNS